MMCCAKGFGIWAAVGLMAGWHWIGETVGGVLWRATEGFKRGVTCRGRRDMNRCKEAG